MNAHLITALFIVGGFILVLLVFVAVQFVANSQYFSGRDYGEDIEYGDDIYGPSLMDVEDEE